NYILWQGDMLAFGPLTRLTDTLAAIGAIALMPHEAREEQDGTTLRVLPEATDPRFFIPTTAPVIETQAEDPSSESEEPQTPTTDEEAEPEATAKEPEIQTNEKASTK
ncbi:MAG: hypothetical protein NC403_09500, partial [Muribaculaceae bacterium]|nr:hypothetical protein [Muribaculaceae bacterium]